MEEVGLWEVLEEIVVEAEVFPRRGYEVSFCWLGRQLESILRRAVWSEGEIVYALVATN